MMLRYQGDEDLDQVAIGMRVAEMIVPYKREHPGAQDALEFEWPDYRETYQPILARFLRELGFGVESTSTAYDAATGRVSPGRFRELLGFLVQGVPVMIHVEGHYMLVVGFDPKAQAVVLNDPSGGRRLTVGFETFTSRRDRWYKDRLGWDGRLLAVWKTEGR